MTRHAPLVALLLLGLAGCASTPNTSPAPADAVPIASVRHVAAPQPAPAWTARADLPADARISDATRALQLEVQVRDGSVLGFEPASPDLAGLSARIETSTSRESVLVLENLGEAPLALSLYVSPDGERFRAVSTCSLAPDQPVYERLPERITHLAVADVRLAPEAGCR